MATGMSDVIRDTVVYGNSISAQNQFLRRPFLCAHSSRTVYAIKILTTPLGRVNIALQYDINISTSETYMEWSVL